MCHRRFRQELPVSDCGLNWENSNEIHGEHCTGGLAVNLDDSLERDERTLSSDQPPVSHQYPFASSEIEEGAIAYSCDPTAGCVSSEDDSADSAVMAAYQPQQQFYQSSGGLGSWAIGGNTTSSALDFATSSDIPSSGQLTGQFWPVEQYGLNMESEKTEFSTSSSVPLSAATSSTYAPSASSFSFSLFGTKAPPECSPQKEALDSTIHHFPQSWPGMSAADHKLDDLVTQQYTSARPPIVTVQRTPGRQPVKSLDLEFSDTADVISSQPCLQTDDRTAALLSDLGTAATGGFNTHSNAGHDDGSFLSSSTRAVNSDAQYSGERSFLSTSSGGLHSGGRQVITASGGLHSGGRQVAWGMPSNLVDFHSNQGLLAHRPGRTNPPSQLRPAKVSCV